MPCARHLSRSPGIASLARVGTPTGYEAPDGSRYVKYSYETQSCQRLDIDGGCDGKPERR